MAQILVVEDNDDVREMMAVSLQLEGHRVSTAVNGRDALDKLQSQSKPDLILLDLMMPGMDGWELRALLQEHPDFRDIPTVVVSAASGDLFRKVPADAYLPKPIDLEKLTEIVDGFCNGTAKR